MPNFRLLPRIALIAACVTALTACGTGSAASDDEFVVLTTFTVIADMAQNVAGDRARVESLTRVGVEIHGYEPIASDVVKAYDADLILDNGLGLEAWFADFVAGVDVPHVTLSAEVEPIEIGGGAYTGRPNPHAWMSPSNAVLYVRAIEAALTDMDPAGGVEYRANANAYIDEIEAVRGATHEAIAGLPAERRVLVTCEGAFSYFAADVGLEEVYLWPVNAESQSTPAAVINAIETVRDRGVQAVFCESTVSSEPMDQVARESGAAFGGTLYVDSLSAPGGPVPTYLALLQHNSDIIVAGLTGQASATDGASS